MAYVDESTDLDREMWEGVAAAIKASREAEAKARDKHNASIDWSWLPERCPDCRLNWSLYPPAKTQTGTGWHDGKCRCVECKRVYGPEAA